MKAPPCHRQYTQCETGGCYASGLAAGGLEQANDGQNSPAKAPAEIGKIEKTLFVLDCLSDLPLRRRVLKGLNKGESKNAVSRAIFFGRHGELREKAYADQTHRTSCLELLVSAIAAWNTVYVERAVTALIEAGEDIPDEYLPHIGNINLQFRPA